MSRYYIAYGSNLSEAQMRYRTPDARIIGTAELEGWRLLFKRHATVEAREGYTTPVLVWEISDRDERNLDLYEGFPHYYRKQELPVVVTPLDGGESVRLTAMVYIMVDGHKKTYLRKFKPVTLTEFNSNNTRLLDKEEIKAKMMELTYIQE